MTTQAEKISNKLIDVQNSRCELRFFFENMLFANAPGKHYKLIYSHDSQKITPCIDDNENPGYLEGAGDCILFNTLKDGCECKDATDFYQIHKSFREFKIKLQERLNFFINSYLDSVD